jgi:hypothetical protein
MLVEVHILNKGPKLKNCDRCSMDNVASPLSFLYNPLIIVLRTLPQGSIGLRFWLYFSSLTFVRPLTPLDGNTFPPCFHNWMAALFFTATSRVLLNGIAEDSIVHGQDLRQGVLTLSLKSLRRRRGRASSQTYNKCC